MQINGTTLRTLRAQKGLTRRDLASQARVNEQTIYRIEKGRCVRPRVRIVHALATALNIDPATLGEALAEPQARNRPEAKSQLNVRLETSDRNALLLVARRYGIKPHHIIEVAPLLFLLAAEASLKQRRVALDELEERLTSIDHPDALDHISRCLTYSGTTEMIIGEERSSIAEHDIFGQQLDGEALNPGYDWETTNPFVTYLRGQAQQTDESVRVSSFSREWGADYSVGKLEALDIVDGDAEAADFILDGLVGLHEIPPELRPEAAKAGRREWVVITGRRRAEERRLERDKMAAELFGATACN